MYKIKNPYKCSILDLNMMEIEQSRTLRITVAEIAIALIPAVAISLIFLGYSFPDFDIVAYCSNVSGGDICHFATE